MKEKQTTQKGKRKSSSTVNKRPRNVSIKTREMPYAQAVKAMYEDSDRTLLPEFRRCE